ncbi:MAG TPA: CHAT domain-containing protein [Pyrinomonadaceae bacterium]|nr:CHAT domain-containing protein [Pyrinomonadaceae bacterium]
MAAEVSVAETDERASDARREADAVAAAEEAFAEAKRLDGQWQEGALRDAVGKYQTASSLWRALGRKDREAAALKEAGQSFYMLGEHQPALDSWARALKLYRETKDRAGEIETLNLTGRLYTYQGDGEKALAHHQKALRLSRLTSNPHGEAQSLNDTGEVYYERGDAKNAVKYLNQALAVWPKTGNLKGRAQTLLYLGYTYTDLSDLPRALEYYRQSLALWREAQDVRGEAQITNAFGLVHSLLGDKEQALEFYGRAANIFRSIGDRAGMTTALNGKGELLSHLNELQQSLDCHEEALALCRALGDIEGELVSLRHMGKIYQARGNAARAAREDLSAKDNYAQAVGYYEQVLKLSTTLKNRRVEALSLLDIGSVYGALAEQSKALDYFDRALRLNRAAENRRGEYLTLNSIGHIYETRGEPKKALTFYTAALPLTRAAKDPARESLTLYNIAHAEFGAGRLAESRAHVESSLQIIESLRTNVASRELRSSYFASVRQYYELYTSVLMRMHRERPAEGLDVLALQASERARARGLLDMLQEADADIQQGISPDLFKRKRNLQQLLNDKAERQMVVLDTKPEAKEAAALAKEAAALSREIRALAAEYDEVEAQIRKQNPRYATLRQTRAPAVGEIQALLDRDTLLLEYALGVERSYLWVVTREEITSHELPGSAEIEKAARDVYQLLTARQPVPGESAAARRQRIADADALYPSKAATLSKILLSPVRERLASKRLLIVPDGALLYIPFGALPSPPADAPSESAAVNASVLQEDGASDAPLIVRHEIVYLPSATVLTALRDETLGRKPAPWQVAVLADPVFDRDDPRLPPPEKLNSSGASAEKSEATGDALAAQTPDALFLPPLPASKDEAEAVMSLGSAGSSRKAIGFDANKEFASGGELKQYRIIHFATHGILDNQQPELSGLVLSRFDRSGNTRDGFLRLHDIYNLDLPVELVVLSACNTGLGKAINGEGLVGLTRGFMYAGASRVMASMWKVDDEATAELMKVFYRKMLGEELTPAAALRQAQLELWRRKRWQAPFFWAAFTLQGDHHALPPTTDAPNREVHNSYATAAGALLLILSLGSFPIVKFARRKRIARRSPHR